MAIHITTLAERPEFIGTVWEMPDSWPKFMDHDPIAWSLFGPVVQPHRDYAVIATEDDVLVGHGHSVPFALNLPGRGPELPDTGWDQILMWAHSDLRKEITPDAVSALEISIHPEHQGKGLSALLLDALRDNAKSKGFTELLAPVRPNGKHLEPHTSMSEYAFRTREDGLPADPWLRVHVRAGGTIVKVAPASQTISGSLEQWRTWTGQPFDVNGPVEVPLTLSPVICDLAQNYAVYVEPNVWVRHSL
ncbi:GNAT family N-acetyltransferase [Nonomuraea longispora]|uniref:GNAT family N-acetyltransferase n=1 Tax=Nonomuraea longispora TaxID=1848320 RepID=A0A4R4NDR6_9ACTN|nr:GNAT family N-acetyltransferase [Nonomuraea longispora]TDC05590.1 GNAT family N-acetyltransferase [Nonomuraea longispora]